MNTKRLPFNVTVYGSNLENRIVILFCTLQKMSKENINDNLNGFLFKLPVKQSNTRVTVHGFI